MSIDLKNKKHISVPFDEVFSEWSFIDLGDEKYVLGIKTVVKGVMKVTEQGGEPVINPQTRRPIYQLQSQPIVQLFTTDEYQAQLEMIKRKYMR